MYELLKKFVNRFQLLKEAGRAVAPAFIDGTLISRALEMFSILIQMTVRKIQLGANYAEIGALDFVVSTRCTLRCKHCSELIQYYRRSNDEISPVSPPPAQDFSIDVLRGNLDTLLSFGVRIYTLSLIGGEPLLYPELAQLIDYIGSKAEIKKILVVSNATIMPNAELLSAMKRNRVFVSLSNYGKLSKRYNEIAAAFRNAGIKVRTTAEQMRWINKGSVEPRNRDTQGLIHQWNNCNHKCVCLVDGQLHNCEASAHGLKLGLIPEDISKYIDIRKESKSTFPGKLRKLIFRKYIPACDYCGDVVMTESNTVPAAEQLTLSTFRAAADSIRA